MIIEQIYTGCLAHGAYYIESGGEVAIVDPLRETEPYLKRAKANNAKIKYVLETHFHADFVSGHIDLARESGAKIIFGPTANPAFEAYVANDNEELKLGKVTIRILHTPGHTMESSTFLLLDENKKPYCLFTGDTLFIGDVGRPDLAVKTNLTKEDLAGMLFDSLRNKIMPLPDDVIIYPGHGAGSACGKNMSDETTDTLGHQKKTNYALRAKMSKQEFIQEVTAGLLPPPAYFPLNAKMNKTGYTSINTILKNGLQPIDVYDFESTMLTKNVLVLDARHQNEFVKGFIPGSLFIGIDGNFAPWAGALIQNIEQQILIVCDPGREEEVVIRLSRVGYDNTIGFLQGGFEAWKEAERPIEKMDSISPEEFAKRLSEAKLKVVDVRKQSEFETSHLKSAINYPLDYIHAYLHKFDNSTPSYLYCAGGYRSVIAASILHSRGIKNTVNVEGGFAKIKESSIPESEFEKNMLIVD